MVYKMTSNRIAFVFAIGLAALALFMNGAEAATLNDGVMLPDDSNRVDAAQDMQFTVAFDDTDETITNLAIIAWFDGTATTHPLSCLDCDGSNPDGTYGIVGTLPTAGSLVGTLGSETIKYGFIASYDESEDGVHWPAQDSTNDSNVRVNTLPVLTDNATVSGGGMPEDTYSLTITYTDVDGHAGIVTATVCDESDTCETGHSLSKQSGEDSTGAVYGTDFETELGGTLTVTVSATDSAGDDAEEDQDTTFVVDTTTPWLKNPSVSPTIAGEDDTITFSVISCVFDESTTGTPSVTVDVNSDGGSPMSAGAGSSLCKNGVIYSFNNTVPWSSNSSQPVTFSANNTVASATDLAGSSIKINDWPTLSNGSATRVFDAFVLTVNATDANSDDGDSFSVYASIEFDTEEKEMTCDAGSCTLTVAESAIIGQMGGERSITFRVVDSWGDESSDGFSQSIDVTKTSDFVMTSPADDSFQPGSGVYEFTIANNGNYEDTFTISATSENGWVGTYDGVVTVGKDESEDFTITWDVPNAATGTVDHWSMDVEAGNDNSTTGSHSGTTTVLFKSDVSVSIGTDEGSEVPNGQVTYSFVITNTGNGDEAFTYETSSAGNWGLAGGSGTTATLAMGASETVVVTHTVHEDAGATDSDTITFNAGGGFPDGSGGTATTTAEQTYGASISFGTSNQGSTLNPGDSFTISYTVTNGGNGNDDFSVFFDASWMSASSGTTLSDLAAGDIGTATATITVPDDAPSGSSSTIAAHVTGGGGVSDDAGAAYTMTVADNTRSASITGESGYTINKGDTSSGTVTITNTGVAADFAVVAMDDALSFDTSVISLGAGQSGTLSFTVHAAATGDVSFSMSDAVDGIAVSHTFAITAREFNSALLTTNTDDCGNTGITCVTDAAGGFDNGEYTNAGTFFTTMTATDANGMTGTHTFSTTIANAAPSVTVPMAPTDTIAQTEQSFSFTVPTDRDGTVTHLVIDWGDGTTFTFDSSALAGKSAVATTHDYTEAGEYTISATAYDNSGDSTIQTTTIDVGDRTVTMGDNSYLYNLIVLIGFFLLGVVLSGTSFKMLQGEIAGDEEMNDRDRQRLESVERRMESLSEREELLEVSAYDASRAATKLEEHLSAFNEILVKAQEIAAEDKLRELEAAEETKQKEEEQMQLDLEDPDIEMVAERFHDALGRLVNARGELSKIEEQLAHILKMERDEQLEKLTEMTESYETTKRKIDALQTSAEARDAAAVENNIMNLLSAAASGGSVGGADFGDFGDLDGGDDEYEVEIYEDEDGSFYYIDPDTGEEVPCDEDGNAL